MQFANYAKKRNALIVVNVSHVSLTLVQGHEAGIFQILWHCSFLQAQEEEFMKVL